MKQKYLNLFILFLISSAYSYAQEYRVKEMKRVMSDLSASTHLRLDSNGIACGIVKVLVRDSSIDFGRNVVGSVDNKVNEYWVYLPAGSKSLTIKRSNFLPMLISFKDYGIDEIESKITYSLELKEVSFNREKCAVIINLIPKDATLKIDGIDVDKQEGGSYRLYLAKGEHICRIDAQGYSPAVEIVTTGKGLQTADVSLESLMASLKIKSKTEGALLFIDGKKVGVSEWEGHLAAGKYTVEAKKDGFLPFQQDVIATEKGTHYVEIPPLKQLLGTIRLVSNISEFTKILLDGEVVVMKDNLILDVNSGKHLMSFIKYGYEKKDVPIIVRGAVEDTVCCELTPLSKYIEALNGNGERQSWAAETSIDNDDYYQAEYWYTQAIEHLDGTRKTEVLHTLAYLYGHKYLYGNKSKAITIYNLAKAEQTYLRLIDYELSRKGRNLSYVQEAYTSLGDINKEAGKYKEAIKWYILAEKHSEGDSGFCNSLDLGDCYMKIGEVDEAKQCYKKAATSSLIHIRNKARLKLEALK